MPVNLLIKNVPDDLVDRLRERAARSHRSLQAELMAILEDALRRPEPLTPTEAFNQVRALGLETSATAVHIIRADRDAR